jgi:hypothetical protein
VFMTNERSAPGASVPVVPNSGNDAVSDTTATALARLREIRMNLLP